MTELVWDGKYDKDGRRVAPLRIALPFQTVETVNESGTVRAHNLDLWSQGKPTEWRNRLIWGDKKYVLPSLLPELAGKVNLIYIDPPFATGADFSFTTTVPETGESFTKEPSVIEQKAYRDTWGRGLDSYLQWFCETAVLVYDLLASDGSVYVHLDWHVGHYAKTILDEVFGLDGFLDEIVWKRTIGGTSVANRFRTQTDSIFLYSKGQEYTFNEQFTRAHLSEQEILDKFPLIDPVRGRYCTDNLANPDYRPTLMYEYKGYKPPEKGWAISLEKMKRWDAEGRLHFPEDRNNRIRRKRFLSEWQGAPVQNLWDDIAPIQSQSSERLGYDTQKPEALLDRIIRASSNEGDLVLDCFCGSGTTAAVAEKLGRRRITCDLGRFAISTARKRLLAIPNVRPFVVQNLGKYERQQWQVAEFGQGDVRQAAGVQLAYRRFILDLYHAQQLEDGVWLHGLRDGRFVHVGSVDAPVAIGDVQQIVRDVWRIRGPAGQSTTNAVDILGWDFAFELNEVARQMAAENNVTVRFKRIPREVLEKRAVEQGDIKFFELAALKVGVSQKDREGLSGVERGHGPFVALTLSDYVVPPDDVPEDVQRAVKSWSQWIDYWAVDWDYQGDTFHNMRQEYRTRKDPKLQTSLSHTYEQSGTYTVVVKVIDILGNDTTKTLKVEVGPHP